MYANDDNVVLAMAERLMREGRDAEADSMRRVSLWVEISKGTLNELRAALAAAEARAEEAARSESAAIARQIAADSEAQSWQQRAEELEKALDGVWQALGRDGKCWCAYERLVHPQDDPQDALELEPNGHTAGCNAARRALARLDKVSTGRAGKGDDK